MRKIKFRGKRLDNGEWIEGGYWLNDTVTQQSHYIIDADGNPHAVDPTTVGQYTGLHDRNGIEICEGDILQHMSINKKESYFVLWNDSTASFYLMRSNGEDRLRLFKNSAGFFPYNVIGHAGA